MTIQYNSSLNYEMVSRKKTSMQNFLTNVKHQMNSFFLFKILLYIRNEYNKNK